MFVQISNLQYKYPNASEPTIKDFTIDIEQGEVVCILGESGSGKSTILRLIAGLEEASNGSISISGKTIMSQHTFTPPEKRGVGMVFQDYALFPHMTVEKNIKYGLRKMSGKEKNQRVEEMLALVNLTEYKKRYPFELSGGQQQRVALARALAPAPSLLIFDEPFSNLDANLQLKIRDELRAILKQTGITSIFVTHDQEDAKVLADRIVFIENGKIKQIGPPEEVLGCASLLMWANS
ncbi:ABC transporter ATP-binding protein [Halalkalibacter akibai]|uniref:Carnitine transport ATP-binding protein OpuCA n=1 Tax=Halalkalibacter akibai (strain ATCC 43226 / DSM 21942 / CIP 109018 / JCM 9157 / 1139) TaxID=1236973 RepID=W4QPB9_HALA3|nr:ABC transporter ATP-binding protein [Halalkalibacter akibai]GAE33199.1 iron ABC transporter [Halalkalibacter akibai JCM 9157]